MDRSGELSIEFELTGPGWIDIRLARGGARFDLEGLSYLTPVLDDLIAAAAPATGDYRAVAAFALEPGYVELACERKGDATWLQAVDVDGDIFRKARRDKRAVEWEMRLSGWDEFSRAVATGARALEKSVGHAGYAERWRSPFPARALAELEKALEPRF